MIMPAAIATAMTIPIPMYSVYFDPPIVSIIGFVIFANNKDSNTNPYLPSFRIHILPSSHFHNLQLHQA